VSAGYSKIVVKASDSPRVSAFGEWVFP